MAKTAMNRRLFLGGLFAAPAIVSVGNIMPVKLIDLASAAPVRYRLTSDRTYYVVAGGSGHGPLPYPSFRTIQEAMEAIDSDGAETAIVHVAGGVHYGPCVVPPTAKSITLVGNADSPAELRSFCPMPR